MVETAQVDPIVVKIVSTIGELPASPAIISSVMSLTLNLDADVEQLGKMLATDQAIAAKVLKLSNSSFYGRSKGVGTLKEAILILGFYTLRSLVIASSTHSLYKRKDKDVFEKKLWEHSLATAIACKIVGKKIRHSRVEEAFIVGLLHDLGKLILSQKLPDAYEEVYQKVEADQVRFLKVEQDILGFSHVDVARVLFEKWNFPSFLISAICNHHSPENDDISEMPAGNIREIPIVYITHFCNHLAKHIDCGFGDCCKEDLTSSPLAKAVGFETQDIEKQIENLDEVYQSEKNLFEE